MHARYINIYMYTGRKPTHRTDRSLIHAQYINIYMYTQAGNPFTELTDLEQVCTLFHLLQYIHKHEYTSQNDIYLFIYVLCIHPAFGVHA